tara:strand:+ start:3636 stop:4238 length:603 start_codon:yes stop_codon:yes gene_type:complete
MNKLVAIILISIIALGSACTWISESNETVNTGIKVHGNWELHVSPPDGEPVTYKFSNDLAQYGSDLLLKAITGIYQPGNSTHITPWLIKFGFTNSGWYCDEGVPFDKERILATMTLEPQSSPMYNILKLTATCTVTSPSNPFPATHTFDTIGTMWAFTDTTSIINNSNYEGERNFTTTQITPLTVQPGYVMSVTVLISFE